MKCSKCGEEIEETIRWYGLNLVLCFECLDEFFEDIELDRRAAMV